MMRMRQIFQLTYPLRHWKEKMLKKRYALVMRPPLSGLAAPPRLASLRFDRDILAGTALCEESPQFDPYEQNPVFTASHHGSARSEGIETFPSLPPRPIELGKVRSLDRKSVV